MMSFLYLYSQGLPFKTDFLDILSYSTQKGIKRGKKKKKPESPEPEYILFLPLQL